MSAQPLGGDAPQQNPLCPSCWLLLASAALPACPSCGAAAPSGGWPRMPYVFRQRYEMVAQLGRGGMGAVFKAYDRQVPDHPWVAVKVAQLKGPPAVRQMLEEAFRREGQAAGMLSQHAKYFVGFRGSDFSDPACLVLDFIEWPTLEALRKKEGMLSAVDVALLGVEILRGVRCMERRRMVHRDLKPENIFVRRAGSGFEIKISDLGIWVDSGEAYETTLFGTAQQMQVGTPPYMSPEHMRGEVLTTASDVHAVGSILWQLATGEVPYPFRPAPVQAEALRERADRMRTSPPRPPEMPVGLYRVLATALRFDAGERTFADLGTTAPAEVGVARGMEKALEDFLAGYAEKRKKALAEAMARIAASREKVEEMRSRLSRTQALMERAEGLRDELRATEARSSEPDVMLRDAERIAAALETLTSDAATMLTGFEVKTEPMPVKSELDALRGRADAAERRAADLEKKLSRSTSTRGGSGKTNAFVIAGTGTIGLVLGIVAMRLASPGTPSEVPESAGSTAPLSGPLVSLLPSANAQAAESPGNSTASAQLTALAVPQPPVPTATATASAATAIPVMTASIAPTGSASAKRAVPKCLPNGARCAGYWACCSGYCDYGQCHSADTY